MSCLKNFNILNAVILIFVIKIFKYISLCSGIEMGDLKVFCFFISSKMTSKKHGELKDLSLPVLGEF